MVASIVDKMPAIVGQWAGGEPERYAHRPCSSVRLASLSCLLAANTMSSERVLLYVFLALIAGYGILGLVAPNRLLQERRGCFVDYMTGRMAYTSIRRVRVSCGLLLGIAALALYALLTGLPP